MIARNNFPTIKPHIPISRTKIKKQIKENLNNNQMLIKLTDDGELKYFFTFKKIFMGEFQENFLFVQDTYCNNKFRSSFYSDLKNIANKFKAEDKIKRIAIEISYDDIRSKKYFSQKGILTYIELLGSTKKSLEYLNEVEELPELKINFLKRNEINQLVKLDIESHLNDKSSRMHEIFKKPNAQKNIKKFYLRLFANKGFLVAKYNGRLAGNIGFFVDKENRRGLIASIFVAKHFQGLGISKLLYKRLLLEFQKKGLSTYLGSSTTEKVLTTAEQIGRVSTKWIYLVPITKL